LIIRSFSQTLLIQKTGILQYCLILSDYQIRIYINIGNFSGAMAIPAYPPFSFYWILAIWTRFSRLDNKWLELITNK